MSATGILLKLEWLAVLIGTLIAYGQLDFSWPLFIVLILAPDLSMLGYLAGPRVGAVAYNAAHTLIAPAVLAAVGWWLSQPLVLALALIVIAHIATDRTLGYGLKYATGFKDTYLGRIGRNAPRTTINP